MPQHHTTGDQVNFVAEWFKGWSEMQRTDFLPSLVRELKPCAQVNGDLPEHFNAMSLNNSNRPPSIFHCQVKLFHDWVGGWSEEEKMKLLSLFKELDASFSESLDKCLAVQGPSGERPQQENIEKAEVAAAEVVPPLQAEAAAPPQPQAPAQPEVNAGGANPPVAAARAHRPESDVDEALDSCSSSPLSSPRPSDGQPDSGMDSPFMTDATSLEDEGGIVVEIGEAQQGLAVREENVAAAEGNKEAADVAPLAT